MDKIPSLQFESDEPGMGALQEDGTAERKRITGQTPTIDRTPGR